MSIESGLCKMHSARQRRWGSPLLVKRGFVGVETVLTVECSVGGCNEEKVARGWCWRHYRELHLKTYPPCAIKGCPDPRMTRGLCSRHYRRLTEHGDPLGGPTLEVIAIDVQGFDADTYFWPHVTKSSGCWEWDRGRNASGYGTVRVNGKSVLAHRVAWTLLNGPIPDELRVLHHCDWPPCCKAVDDADGPAHLFTGTYQDNALDMYAKGRRPKRLKMT